MNPSSPRPNRIETSLGPSLVAGTDCWSVDLGALPIMHGLSVLSRALSEMIVGQVRSDRIDVSAERRLRPRENPELLDQFGIDLVKVSAEHETVAAIAQGPEVFERRLRALLGSLQRQRYRDALLPTDRRESRALVAEFGDAAHRHRFVLEYVPAHRDDEAHDLRRGFFRITIEGCTGRRLDLASIPHLRIDDIEDRHFIAGSTRIAQTWTEAVRREAERGRRSFFEQRHPHSHLFRQLDQADLRSIQRVSIQWSESVVPLLVENEPAEISETLKRVLLALEDRNLRNLLAQREVVRVDGGLFPVYLDIAQLGRVLELSLGRRRERSSVESFLARMPSLASIASRETHAAPLRDVSVFLVHHITGEVLGLIAALRALGCRDLVVQFVTYAGEAPASYLDAVLDLPGDEFRALALANVPRRGRVEGHYRLSTQYSRLDEADEIATALRGRDTAYLPAMRAAAVGPFLRQIARAERAGRRCLLIEDGGYLGPIVNDAALSGRSLRAFAADHGYALADERGVDAVYGGLFLGSVEHTRNGFDRLAEVQAQHGRLALPAFSIAISKLKREVESREVAASVLNAVETVLNADGRILSRRSCLVLGSRGAIGSELVRGLRARLDDADALLAGVDAKVAHDSAVEARTLRALGSERWRGTDLVLGVTGDSVIQGDDVVDWLLHSPRRELILASGSTKTVEFRDVMAWLDGLLQGEHAMLGGRSASIRVSDVLDPRTGRLYGHRYLFRFEDDGRERALLCLANLTPINFLFYGVATELIDEVLAQLLSVALGLRRRRERGAVPAALCAVDREIDADGEPRAQAPS
ncbi:MAG: hypothetical protein U1F36_21780 [Planctomycetota bacterium]